MFKLVYTGPSELKTLAYRLITIGIILLIGFNFGSWFYLYTVSNFNSKVKLRTFATTFNASSNNELKLSLDDKIIIVKSDEIKTWIESYKRSYSNKEDLRISSKMSDFLKSLAVNINTEPINAKFEFRNNKAVIFSPSHPGKKLDFGKSSSAIIHALREGKSSIELIVENVNPEITLEKINSLGIETLLAQGESSFTGSSNARVHNIKTGAAKLNGSLLKPGEEFSFNNLLGEITDKTGYQPELVIKNGVTTPEYGGGLCQVSTTLFRSAILSGFPITERRPHSFPVKYYNPQGFDATIYPGVSDLKFINDTQSHILIQTKIEETKLLIEIYGSNDGRIVTMDGPHQYDQKTSGAMKAYFTRSIFYENNEKKEERFDSNYKPPFAQARNPLE